MYNKQGKIKEAEKWWLKAAQLDHRRAQRNLGLIHYKQGKIKEAKEWWSKVAKQGFKEPQYNLKWLLKQEEKNRNG